MVLGVLTSNTQEPTCVLSRESIPPPIPYGTESYSDLMKRGDKKVPYPVTRTDFLEAGLQKSRLPAAIQLLQHSRSAIFIAAPSWQLHLHRADSFAAMRPMPRIAAALLLLLRTTAALRVPEARAPPPAPAKLARRGLLAAAPALALGAARAASAATAIENEFRLADTTRDGKLTIGEFTTWYEGNDLLSKKDLFSFDLSLPEIALDLTGLAGIVVAIYGVSYAYYLQQKMEAADAKAAKKAAADKKKAAAAKKAEAEAKKAAAAAAKEADEST